MNKKLGIWRITNTPRKSEPTLSCRSTQLTIIHMQSSAFWVWSSESQLTFWKTKSPPFSEYSLSLKMEVTCSPEISVDIHWTTRHYIPKDRTLHSHCCENLKSNISMIFLLLEVTETDLWMRPPQKYISCSCLDGQMLEGSTLTISGGTIHTTNIALWWKFSKYV
jgi:hypothetical protein